MPKYVVHWVNHTSAFVEVEAEDPEDALEVSDGKFSYPYLCAQCSDTRYRGRNDGEWLPECVEDAEGNLVLEGLDP